jgi:hypothetical protein
MRNPLAHIKTIVLFSAIAFAGHVLAAPETWFSGTANGEALDAVLATWDTNVVGEVTVAADVLSIDLPTNTVVKLTPSSYDSKSDMKTYVVVDDAVFTPTAYDDIDNTVVDGAQTALTVAYDDTPTTNYYAYIGGTWKKLAGATPGEEAVDVTIELDYSKPAETNASFKVGSTTLYDASETDVTSFPISGTQRCLSRIELAGYGKIHSVTTSVEAAVNVTITPTSVTYGADFTNVTIVATLSGEGYDQATYTLDWNGTPVQATVTRDGTTLTITAPIDAPSTGTSRASATYDIKVNGGTSGTQNTTVADNRNWITENSTAYESTGTWETDIAYDGSPAIATVADNTYTASSCSTGDLVTITFENLCYTEFSDLSVATPAGTQGAFALAETNINAQASTNFCVLVMENENYTWMAADCTVPAAANVNYTIVMTFDYVSKKYSVKVSDGTNEGNLTVGGQSQFDLCVTKAAVTDFVFKGSGTMSGIKGVDSTCFMAKDGLGNWYTTIAAALASGGNGPFIILRDTGVEAPNGWQFVTEDGVMKLIKKVAKGLFFMAY